MIIDHVCIAVKNLGAGIEQWTAVYGYKQMTKEIINTRQKVKVVFLHKENSLDIKLIEPVDDTSPIYSFTRRGGGLHHIGFKCANIETELEYLRSKEVKLLVGPQPGEAFENEDIAFLLDKFGLNMELIDSDKRAGRL